MKPSTLLCMPLFEKVKWIAQWGIYISWSDYYVVTISCEEHTCGTNESDGHTKRGLGVIEVFRVLGFPNRLLLPIYLASQHGHLVETTEVLAVNSAFNEQARKRLKNLLLYPLFLFVIIFLLFSVFRIYFIPNMETLLSKNSAQSDSSLALTNTLLNLPNTFVVSLFSMILLCLFLWLLLRKKSMEIKIIFFKRTPILNSWFRLLVTRIFSREIGVLLESGMSLQESFTALINQKKIKYCSTLYFRWTKK